ncbi:NADAR family protein [Patescibacteria group bacterium]
MPKKLKQHRDPQLETSGEVIGFYEREFYPFSNFSSFEVKWHGRVWKTAEQAYQASHFFDTAPELVEEIITATSAHEAYKIAKSNAEKAPRNWEDIKIDIMEDICEHKLQQHPYVQRKLLQTKDLLMIEDSPKDSFWGWGEGRKGRNELGKVWMKLRGKLNSSINEETEKELLTD